MQQYIFSNLSSTHFPQVGLTFFVSQSLWPYPAPIVEVPADLADQSLGVLSVSVAGEAKAPSSKLTWDLLPTPGGDRVHVQLQKLNWMQQDLI